MSQVLFEIKEENLESGLRGFPIGYCTTSSVDPTKGLFYSGISVDKLAYKEPEAVIYLLYHGKLPDEAELRAFKADLAKRAHCPKELIQAIYRLPRQGHPMALFSMALLLMEMYVQTGDWKEDCLNLIAKIPEVTAAVLNHSAGWGETGTSDPEKGMIENFTSLLKVPGGDSQKLLKIFKLFNILHYDHGGGNLSTFVGKAIASGLEGMYGSMAGAMNALAGPRHGRANQDCLEFVQLVRKEVGDEATVESIEALIRKRLAANQLVFGFGHAVLRVEDPRAAIFYDVAKKEYGTEPLVKIALLLREAGPKVLAENPKIADPYPNVDAISGTLLSVAGFPYPEFFTVLFGMSRIVGIAIQILYERVEARGGKGTPIVRPKYIYKPRA